MIYNCGAPYGLSIVLQPLQNNGFKWISEVFDRPINGVMDPYSPNWWPGAHLVECVQVGPKVR